MDANKLNMASVVVHHFPFFQIFCHGQNFIPSRPAELQAWSGCLGRWCPWVCVVSWFQESSAPLDIGISLWSLITPNKSKDIDSCSVTGLGSPSDSESNDWTDHVFFPLHCTLHLQQLAREKKIGIISFVVEYLFLIHHECMHPHAMDAWCCACVWMWCSGSFEAITRSGFQA